MAMPKIEGPERKKPLCYDPERGKFIYFDEIVSGAERIVPIETLADDDLRRLVIERQRAGPDYTVQAISGPPHTRDDVIRAIERNEPFGQLTLEAEKSYLHSLLREIEDALDAE